MAILMGTDYRLLLDRYLAQTATVEERDELYSLIQNSDSGFDRFLEETLHEDLAKASGSHISEETKRRLIESILKPNSLVSSIKQFWWALRGTVWSNLTVIQYNDKSLKFIEPLPPAVFSNTGEPLKRDSPEYGRIISNVKIVDQSILDKIKRNANEIHSLTPRQFEEMVAELLEKMGYKVQLTPLTKDGGKDIIIASNKDIGRFMYYVECKKYAPDNPVKLGIVKQLYATVIADNVTAGILVTTSHFTKGAKDFAENQLHQLSLIDLLKLNDLLKRH
jgi:HJR/Mrr/RecB family endonuclease